MSTIGLVYISEAGMYHVFDENRGWLETKWFTTNHPVYNGFKYVQVPKDEYPVLPIKDGVYRCHFHRSENRFVERKNNKWWYGSGEESTLDWEIIERMK